MSSSLEKLKALTSKLEDKLEQKGKRVASEISHKNGGASGLQSVVDLSVKNQSFSDHNDVRQKNIERVKSLYEKLKIYEKSPNFDTIFMYKAMNLSGIGLKEDDFGEVREGKYIQVIAITYEPDKNGKKKAKNISLGYFGKAETLEGKLKNEIIEFVLRWRYEKAFQNVEHYKDLIAKVDIAEEPKETLF